MNFLTFVADQWLLFGILISLSGLLFFTEARRRTPALASASATRLINLEDALVLDLRPPKEYHEGHIAGAVQVQPSEALNYLRNTGVGAERPLLLVCANSHVSRGLSNTLVRSGYPRVSLLQGGINNWRLDNMPLVHKAASKAKEKEKKPVALAVPAGKKGRRRRKKSPATSAARNN